MSELVTTGTWLIRAGEEAAFVEEWTRFAEWAASFPGSTTLRLGFDVVDPQRYMSFAAWASADAAHAWKQTPDFRDRMARLRQHVEAFEPTEVSVVAAVSAAAPAASI